MLQFLSMFNQDNVFCLFVYSEKKMYLIFLGIVNKQKSLWS